MKDEEFCGGLLLEKYERCRQSSIVFAYDYASKRLEQGQCKERRNPFTHGTISGES
jgi:hypothetical protein